MADDVVAICRTKEQAYEATVGGYALAKRLLADGRKVRIVVAEDVEPLAHKQRKFFHGVVLKQIAERVVLPDGTRYVAAVWKEYFRDLFLPAKWKTDKRPRWDPELRRLVIPKRATPRKVPRSTEELDERRYAEFTENVIAHAITELGVVFEFDPIERDGVRYVVKRGKRQTEELPE